MTAIDLTKVAPWSDDTPQLLPYSLTHLSTATLILPSGETMPLDLLAGTVSWDEARSPRVEARLTCRVPTDQAQMDRIDPRTGVRLVITAGYRRQNGLEDVQPLCDLGLRTRVVNRPANEMTLVALSDEALVIDDAPSNGGTCTGTNTVEGIKQTVRRIFPGLAFTTGLGGAYGPAVSQSPLGDKWDLVTDLADRIEAQVFDDGTRSWYIIAPPVLSTPALQLAVGAAGTITASETGLDRDAGWYNRVFVTYEWRDGSDVDHTVVAVRSITSGPYAAAAGNTRTLELHRDVPTTQTEANASATSLVRRTVTRGRSFQVTGISAYWLRPGHTVELALPLGDPEQHLCTAVTFDLKSGDMDVTTRLPDGTYTIGA